MNGWMKEMRGEWMDGWMDEMRDECINGQMNKWMDGLMSFYDIRLLLMCMWVFFRPQTVYYPGR